MTHPPLDHVICVRCKSGLDLTRDPIECDRCQQQYPRADAIPVLLPRPDDKLHEWRQQLAVIVAQEQQARAGLEQEARRPGVLPDGLARIRGLAEGVRAQALEVLRLIGPALAGPRPSAPQSELPPGLKYVHYLYRDWAWEHEGNRENERAFDAIARVRTDPPLGRTLVLGAGGCRLAYDLHGRCGATETCVVDIDPFLFLIAHTVVRGGTVEMTESTPTVGQAANAKRSWTLHAPRGPLPPESFHFLLTNGLDPPFAPASFDSVVTPWFIDQVPPDLPAFLSVLKGLLRPGGRWLNQGPLLYPPNTPLFRRYSREEVFDLAARAGFEIGRWSYESHSYLVSPLNLRGKVEAVLTFEATAKP